MVALRRIPSVAASALLLNKAQQANGMNIPIYVTVAEDIAWTGMRDEELTQVLGVLLDNAIEATAACEALYVAVEASNQKGWLVLTVRNTYAGEPPVFSSTIACSRPGHEGLGLRCVRRIVKRTRAGTFNIYTCGRYVEASIMLR